MSTLLVSAAELAVHTDDPGWRVFDCRHDLVNTGYGAQAYAKGHIPGALFMGVDDDLSGPKTGKTGRHPLPDPEVFAARMSACGVGPDTQVVAYDNEGNVFASRLWWMLRHWLGHEKVAVLDGGLAGWKRAKQPLTDEVQSFPHANFTPRPRDGVQVDAAFVMARLSDPKVLMLDARSEERFSGEQETIDPVAGHIPGAINRFYFDNLDDPGIYFKPAAELREEFDALLAGRPPANVIQQCGSGVTACHNILAMELAGLPGSSLYVGSWSEWCSDPSRPIEKGY
ncbi:MAG: sulfurtransferase [Candidatus Nitricoxidivorans perseverans]|uniref:Sulfurtransferase n=1 Tax=Candidatus Nitricoxidivorans perseverans TaxID=2975601 RepID=A0AA49FJY5_9PROT|nr:MAG: sulfurtransferase [Candidatus Nitricoxidivorans perseverans]